MTRQPRGRWAAAIGVVVLAGTLSGCESPIHATALEGSMETTFTHLYALTLRQRDLPVDETDLNTAATCRRDNADSPLAGPGNDWICNLTWRTPAATTAGATYSVTMRPDGCFTADGDGPADLVGSQTLVDATGETVVNVLWALDGCLVLR